MSAPNEKTPAPDPEIPNELRAKLSKPKRPTGYRPKSEDAVDLKNKDGSDATPPEEVEEVSAVKNLRPFFKKLAVCLKAHKPTRLVVEFKDVKRQGQWIREERKVKIPVNLITGVDGLPYTVEPVSADETRRIRSMNYDDAPAMLATHGDLTPAFAEWLYLTHPYDAAVRYAGRSTHVQVAAASRV